MSENDIQNSILQYLAIKKIGSFERINNVPVYDAKTKCYRRLSKYAKKGVCDIIGCYHGQFVGIEVKTPSEYKAVLRTYDKAVVEGIDSYVPKTKKDEHFLDQIKYINEKNKNGGYCFFTYSLDHAISKLSKLAAGAVQDENRMCI